MILGPSNQALAGDSGRSSNNEIVAAVIIAEAGGESLKCQIAVYEVIRNRSKTKNRTPAQICLIPSQFSCLNKTSVIDLVNKSKRHKQWNTILKLVEFTPKTNYIKNANHFENAKIRPYWVKQAIFVSQIGKMRFYYLGQFK